MFFNAELPNPYTVESLQKAFQTENIHKTVTMIQGYIILAMNKYGTDWTVYVINTAEDEDKPVYVSDEDELIVSDNYEDLFVHYLNQSGAELYKERLEKFLLHFDII